LNAFVAQNFGDVINRNRYARRKAMNSTVVINFGDVVSCIE